MLQSIKGGNGVGVEREKEKKQSAPKKTTIVQSDHGIAELPLEPLRMHAFLDSALLVRGEEGKKKRKKSK